MAKAGGIEPDFLQRGLANQRDELIIALSDRALPLKRGVRPGGCVLLARARAPRRLYLCGRCTRQDAADCLFFQAAPTKWRMTRAFFHAFMGQVRERLEVFRCKLKRGERKGDVIPPVASARAAEMELLGFDSSPFSITPMR
jgi:predicted ATPase